MTLGPVVPYNVGACNFSLSASFLPTISPVSTMLEDCTDTTILHYRVVPQELEQEADREILTEVAAKIKQFNSNLTAFQPSLAIISTWKGITNRSQMVSRIMTCIYIKFL